MEYRPDAGRCRPGDEGGVRRGLPGGDGPLIKLPQTAGRSESEIFFDALAVNAADVDAGGTAEGLLEPFSAALAAALEAGAMT